MAIVSAICEFIMVDVGVNGRISENGILQHTLFWQMFQNNDLKIPHPCNLPNTTETFQFVFVADEAFSLQNDLMKPSSPANLNTGRCIVNYYQLSHIRHVVENSFRILVTKFGVFQKDINLCPEKANKVTMACWHLHNHY